MPGSGPCRLSSPIRPAYLTLVNRGEVAVAIVGASSNVAEKVELHTTRKVDGLMRMEQLEALAVAPGERVELAPGGTHLMLLGLAYQAGAGRRRAAVPATGFRRRSVYRRQRCASSGDLPGTARIINTTTRQSNAMNEITGHCRPLARQPGQLDAARRHAWKYW